jgi:hypothetical protein
LLLFTSCSLFFDGRRKTGDFGHECKGNAPLIPEGWHDYRKWRIPMISSAALQRFAVCQKPPTPAGGASRTAAKKSKMPPPSAAMPLVKQTAFYELKSRRRHNPLNKNKYTKTTMPPPSHKPHHRPSNSVKVVDIWCG